jgi:hypothetical protein
METMWDHMWINSYSFARHEWTKPISGNRPHDFGNLAQGCCSAVFDPQAVRDEHDKFN